MEKRALARRGRLRTKLCCSTPLGPRSRDAILNVRLFHSLNLKKWAFWCGVLSPEDSSPVNFLVITRSLKTLAGRMSIFQS